MSFGIGLGAFVGGFEKGYGLGERIQRQKRADKLQAEEDASKERLKTIETDTQTRFDEGVKAGTEDANKFDDFWLKYALPKRKMEMLRSGDIAGAKTLMDWGTSENTLKGGRLYASAMTKANLGDTDGAWDDAIASAKTKGYVDHDFNILGRDTLQQDGRPIGTRLRVSGGDGKEFNIDVPLGEDATAISSVLNPDAVAKQNAEYKAEQRKRREGMEDYTEKKKVDQKYATERKDYDADSYNKVREDFAKNDLDFLSLSDEEQDKKVRAALNLAETYSDEKKDSPGLSGRSSRPAPPQKFIVDQTTGKPVAAAAPQGQVGLGPQATSSQQLVAPEQQPAPQQAAPAQAQPQPQAQAAPSRAQIIADAANYMAQGGNPELIAQSLVKAGIAPPEWPRSLQQALQSAQTRATPSLPQGQ
jgi:hypothetical protein